MFMVFVAALAIWLVGQPRIIDADTIELQGQRLRLTGIDAPETRQICTNNEGQQWPCGEAATHAFSQRIGTGAIQCRIVGRDTKWNRDLARCFKGDVDLNKWLVRSGWAVSYSRDGSLFMPDEAMARFKKRGLWQGQFEEPCKFRATC